MQERESAELRMYPPFYHPRFYYLRMLRKSVENMLSGYFKGMKDGEVLDYGCGNTPYKELVLKYVKSYKGADLKENTKADIILEPEGAIPVADNSVDAILSTQVLEHVVSPDKYLREASRVLKKDGLLLISTHGYWMYHPDPTDYWRWTSAGLRKIIEEKEFEIVAFEGIIGRAAMGLQLFQDGILFKLPKFLWYPWAMLIQPQIWFFDLICGKQARNNDACTYIIVAKKK